MVPPLFVEAVIYSSLLALLSTGLTLIYMTTRVVNFAHGLMAALGVYVGLIAARIWGSSPYYFLPLSFALGGLTALAMYKLTLEPLTRRGASTVLLMIATIALMLVLLASVNILADFLREQYKIASRFFTLRAFDFELAGQPGLFMIAPAGMTASITALHLLFTKTKFGVAMRATIENPQLASVVGVNVDMVYTVSWLLAGGVAASAGNLASLWFTGSPEFGIRVLLSLFAASIVGGLLSIYGAALGGWLVGLAEILGVNYLATWLGYWIVPYRPLVPLLAIVFTLLIAPRGLGGVNWAQKVRALRVRFVTGGR